LLRFRQTAIQNDGRHQGLRILKLVNIFKYLIARIRFLALGLMFR